MIAVELRRLPLLRLSPLALVLTVLFALQLILAARQLWSTVFFAKGIDYLVLTEAGSRIAAGQDPYQTDVFGIAFRWHPLTAWFFYAIAPLGILVWRAVNAASLLLLRDWRLIALALLSWPFWDAMASGTVTPLVVCVGFAALSRSRWASVAYLALCLLIPRPWMLPLALWLVWKRPELRLPAVGILALGILAALASGWASEWMAMLIVSSGEMASPLNWAPTRWLGAAWLLVGIPLGIWLTWKGRLGLAGIAIAPYAFAHYFLALLWEARHSANNDESLSTPTPRQEGAGPPSERPEPAIA